MILIYILLEEMTTKGKVFMLDCLPNVPENLDYYFNNNEYYTYKTASLLDISAGL
jgi:hypothetical protein